MFLQSDLYFTRVKKLWLYDNGHDINNDHEKHFNRPDPSLIAYIESLLDQVHLCELFISISDNKHGVPTDFIYGI